MLLIGRHLSPFVRRVAVSLRLLELPYEHRPLSTSGDAAEIRRICALGRVPILILADGEMLIESAAILDVIDETVGPGRALTPRDGMARRRALRLMGFATGAAEKAVGAYYETTRRPPEKQWPDWAAGLVQQMYGALAEIEAAAPEKGWLMGEALSQPDISAVCAVDFIRTVLPDALPLGTYPRLDRLAAKAGAMPAFAETRP